MSKQQERWTAIQKREANARKRTKAQKLAATNAATEFKEFVAACQTDDPKARTRANVMYAAYLAWREGKFEWAAMSQAKLGRLVRGTWKTTHERYRPYATKILGSANVSTREKRYTGPISYYGVKPPDLSGLSEG
jgi:hypothetical protein